MRLKTWIKQALNNLNSIIKNWANILENVKDKIISWNWDNYQWNWIQKEIQEDLLNKLSISYDPLEQLWKVSEIKILNLIDNFREWNIKSESVLEEIFLDFWPIFRFKQSGLKKINKTDNLEFDILLLLEDKLETLNDFYFEISKSFKNPILYLKDKAQIHFYDFMLQLEIDSNQALIFEYLYQFPFWEWKNYSDIYKYLTWEDFSENSREAQLLIKHALNWINTKTIDRFWFSLIKKNKLMLTLLIPSEFVKNQI